MDFGCGFDSDSDSIRIQTQLYSLPTCDVLLEELLCVVGVVLAAALPEPLLHVHHRPLAHRLGPGGRDGGGRRRRGGPRRRRRRDDPGCCGPLLVIGILEK